MISNESVLQQIRDTGFVNVEHLEAVLRSTCVSQGEQQDIDDTLKLLLPFIPSSHDIETLVRLLLDYPNQDLIASYLSTQNTSTAAYALRYIIETDKTWPLAFPIAVLRSGVSVNDELDDSGLTPLQLSAVVGKAELFNLFLMEEANLYIKNKHGMSAYDYALAGESASLLTFLLSYEKAEQNKLSN